MQAFHCPITGQALLKIGTDKGNPVYWCERTDTAYQITEKDNPGHLIGIMPKCLERTKNVWIQSTASVSSISEQARATSDE